MRQPKFKIGDICLFIMPGFEDEPNEWKEIMEISGKAIWCSCSFNNHPEGGFWQYPIKDKANYCPEDMLIKAIKTKQWNNK